MTGHDYGVVAPARLIRGKVRIQGDKSISHRAAMIAGLASGESLLKGFLTSEDCMNTLMALSLMGAEIHTKGDEIRIAGTGGRLKAPKERLDMGNSGTGIRLMAGILAGQPFITELTGDASLRSRPMRRIKEPLDMMGAQIELLGPKGCAPIRISGGALHGIEYKLPVASAQVKSCVLLAALFAEGRTVVTEPAPTRDHTERMFRAAGLKVSAEGGSIEIDGCRGGPDLKAMHWSIPGDFSSCAFWIGAAAGRPGSEAVIENVGLNPRRTAFLDVLERMGADVRVEITSNADWEPTGTITVRGAELSGTEVGGGEIPNLIDELPMVAVLGALAGGKTVIRDAKELRVKESDRIKTVVLGLRAFGVKVEEQEDGMVIHGGAKIRGGGAIASHDDHRIAMSMAVLGMYADGPMRINGVACIATSYPRFWEDFATLTGKNA